MNGNVLLMSISQWNLMTNNILLVLYPMTGFDWQASALTAV